MNLMGHAELGTVVQADSPVHPAFAIQTDPQSFAICPWARATPCRDVAVHHYLNTALVRQVMHARAVNPVVPITFATMRFTHAAPTMFAMAKHLGPCDWASPMGKAPKIKSSTFRIFLLHGCPD